MVKSIMLTDYGSCLTNKRCLLWKKTVGEGVQAAKVSVTGAVREEES